MGCTIVVPFLLAVVGAQAAGDAHIDPNINKIIDLAKSAESAAADTASDQVEKRRAEQKAVAMRKKAKRAKEAADRVSPGLGPRQYQGLQSVRALVQQSAKDPAMREQLSREWSALVRASIKHNRDLDIDALVDAAMERAYHDHARALHRSAADGGRIAGTTGAATDEMTYEYQRRQQELDQITTMFTTLSRMMHHMAMEIIRNLKE